ncbi:hypothetical protein ACF3NG_02065 [Aerococcaceae bacterium WGS1372]
MAQLKYEPLTEPILTCEKVFEVQKIYSQKQLQKSYDRSSIGRGAIGHVISLDDEQIILLNQDEPSDNPTVIQHLLEDLQFELAKLVKQEPTLRLLDRQEKMVSKYHRIIQAILALPEDKELDEEEERDLIAEKLSC